MKDNMLFAVLVAALLLVWSGAWLRLAWTEVAMNEVLAAPVVPLEIRQLESITVVGHRDPSERRAAKVASEQAKSAHAIAADTNVNR